MTRNRQPGDRPETTNGAAIEPVISRRRWRAIHKPSIRRGDPIIEFAEWSLPVASVITLMASFGIAKREPVPREASAIVVIACAAAIVLVLVALSIRLFLKRVILPFSRRAGFALAGVSIISPLVLWARYGGTFAPPVITACVANGLCLVVGGLALFAGRRRSPRGAGADASESRLDDAAA
jgi:hypothetical protein